MKLGADEDVWVCPPLLVVNNCKAVMAFMEMETPGTVVVPDWEDQPWYLHLRHRSVASTPLPWSRQSPTMVDCCHGSDQAADPHGVNKCRPEWGFRAFLVDNRGGRAVEAAEGVVRQEIVGAPTRSRLTLASPDEKCGGHLLTHVSVGRPLKVLDLCTKFAVGCNWARYRGC